MTSNLPVETKSRGPKTRRATWLSALILALVFGCGLLLVLVRQKAADPLGPALSLPASTPARQEVGANAPGAKSAQPSAIDDQGQQDGNRYLEPPGSGSQPAKPVCGGPERMLILAVGADANNYLYGLSDVIRIVRVDFVHPSITVVSLPRDLWVEIPGIADHYGITHGKLNQAYLFGNPGMGYYDGPAGGPGLLARTIQLNYGLAVDHYAAADMETFVRIIDALGGVEIDLPFDVDGGDLSGGVGLGYFAAGRHHLNGEQALKFSRIRQKYSESQRRDNQSLILQAVADQLLKPAGFAKIPQLVEAFRENVLLDLSPEQIVQLTCLFRTAGKDRITLIQLPAELYTHGWIYSEIFKKQTNIVEADPQKIREYLQMFAAGEWP